jgi:hypothetical protein
VTQIVSDAPGVRESILAASDRARRFQEAGGYEAAAALRDACLKADVPHVCIVQLFDENTPDAGRAHFVDAYVPEGASLAVLSASFAAEDRFEELLSALAAQFGVPVGEHGDGDVAPEPTEGG